MLNQFQYHITNRFSFIKGKRFLLATSGGIDSMVLLHLFYQSNFQIAVAHCNFQLRGDESDADAVFVKKECEKLKVPIFIKNFETTNYAKNKKLSTQVAARNLRYNWFEQILIEENFDYIVTAHHQDDNVETFLINFIRGTGIEGLTGIPAQNEKIIRPLLPFSRKEIETFAKKNKIQWREDSSNVSNNYLRNKIRHDIIPIIKELNASFLNSFQNTIQHIQASKSLVDDASKMVYKQVVQENDDKISINLDLLLKYQNYKAYLHHWLQPYGFAAWNDVYDLIHSQTGKKVLSETHELLKNRNQFLLYPISNSNSYDTFDIDINQKEVNFPIKLSLCNVSNISIEDSNCIFVDQDKLQFPIQVRKWHIGDIFYPKGMEGKKKLSKFFKDEKYSLFDKINTWLLCSNNEIVWVINKRQDNRFVANNSTKNILKIKINE
jgi:tRNA(Ile)-lysidine synthase